MTVAVEEKTQMIYCHGEHVKAVKLKTGWYCTGCGKSVKVVE